MKFLFYKYILVSTAVLSLRTIHILGTAIGLLAWVTNSRIRRISEKNIALCFPELDTHQQNQLVKKVLFETGKNILETGKMWQGDIDSTLSLIQECENQHLIDQALKNKQGVILAIPHYGSWELTGLYMAKHYPMTSMYAPQSNQQIDDLIRTARSRTGANLVPTDNKGIRALSKALKQGELVSILPDQSPKSNGVFAPFFGQQCYTMTLLSKLAKSSNAKVIYTYAKRLDNSQGFKLIFREGKRDLTDLDLQESVAELNLNIENLVRETPQSYQWTYKRFKKQPDDLPSVY